MYVISIQAGQKFVVQQLDRRDFISKTNFQKFIEQKMAPESKANISNKKMISVMLFIEVLKPERLISNQRRDQ